MAKVLEFSAKSVEEAVKNASAELNIAESKLKYEVKEEAKKGLFGIGAQDAVIKVTVEMSPDELAFEFVKTVLRDMELPEENAAFVNVSDKEARIEIKGDEMGLIIGHHGEILESLQYLTNLAANKGKDGFRRYVVDIENYRERREDALRKLAQKTAARAKRQGRNITLEPMSAYERRIIHSEVQDIPEVTTFSVGQGDQRKVVVSPENKKPHTIKPQVQRQQKPSAPKEKKELDPSIPLTYPGGGVSKQPVVKAKSIDDLPLADPDESEIY